jgi:hypothetical protein
VRRGGGIEREGKKSVPIGEDDSPHRSSRGRVYTAAGPGVSSVHEGLVTHLPTAVVVSIVCGQRSVHGPSIGTGALRDIVKSGEDADGRRVQEK